MRVTFLGAAREVTGSNILLEANGKRILLDCGLFQGGKTTEARNHEPFGYDPKTIDFVILCHAHLDHTGRIPKLVKEGFRGKIFSTAPTRELAQLVMEDNAKLMFEEHKRKENGPRPIYDKRDVEPALQLFETIGYGVKTDLGNNVFLTLKNAGHILGSAVAVIEAEGKTLAYTSDLGNRDCELLVDPEIVEHADYVISEATYGGRIHEDPTRREQKLTEVLDKTIAQGGVLMIPSFAIERTQELLHDIEHYCETGKCLIPTFYLDSPLASKATKIFEQFPEFLSPDLKKENPDIFGMKRLKVTTTSEESKEINFAPSPKIIIAGSGMMSGGRILFHLERYIGVSNNSILIIGYQGEGTLGRRIFEGEHEIKIFGKMYEVRAGIYAIGSYSAHADSVQLLDWIGKIQGVSKLFLVHAEPVESEAFKKSAEEKLGVETHIANFGETIDL